MKFFNAVRIPEGVNPLVWALDARATLGPGWMMCAEQAVRHVMSEMDSVGINELIATVSFGQVTARDLRISRNAPRRVTAARIVEHINREVRNRPFPGYFDPNVDISCSIMVFHSREFGVSFAKIFTEQSALRDAFQALPGVTNFEYWNNSDPPDDVARTEWDFRREVIDNAIGDSTYGQSGVKVRCDNYGLGRLGADAAAAKPGDWLSEESLNQQPR